MKFANFSLAGVLLIFLSLLFPKNTDAEPNNLLLGEPNRQLPKSDLLVAQTGVPEVDRQVPNLSNPEQVIENRDRLSDFEYEDVDYWENLCELFNRTGQTRQANQACSRVIELNGDDNDPDVWLARGISLFESGEYAEAVASFDEAVDISEDYSLALTNRCAGYFQLALYEDAVADCVAALDKDGDWKDGSPVDAWYYQGLTLSRLGRLEAALINYEKAILHTPEYNLAHAERCRVLLELKLQGENVRPCFEDKAIARYELAIANNPNNVVALTNQGLYFEALDREQRASNSYDRALEIVPQSSFVLARRCVVANELGKYQEALSSCSSALEGDRILGSMDVATVWSQQSRALVGLEQYQQALYAAERAIALDSGIAESWNNKGVSLWFLDRTKEALVAVQRAIDIDPQYSDGLSNYGRILSSLDRYEEALDFYDRALKTNINDKNDAEVSDIWVNRSFALFNLDSCQKALESTQQAVALDPDSFEGWYNQGIALACLGQYQLALDAYQKAEEIRPESVNLYTAKAIALENTGSEQEALRVVEQALNLDSNYQPALNLRERLLRTINRVDIDILYDSEF